MISLWEIKLKYEKYGIELEFVFNPDFLIFRSTNLFPSKFELAENENS